MLIVIFEVTFSDSFLFDLKIILYFFFQWLWTTSISKHFRTKSTAPIVIYKNKLCFKEVSDLQKNEDFLWR